MTPTDYGSYEWPPSGSGSGVTIYASFADFPASAPNGTIAKDGGAHILYEYNSSTVAWEPIASHTAYVDALASAGSATSIGALDSQPENANGLALVGGVLSSQSADATHPGMVNNTTQSFSGNKTFTGTISASNLSGTNTGDVTLTAVGAVPNANGASLSGQALTLQPANTSFPGVLTAADWNTFNSKQSTITIGALDAQAANANGLALVSNVLSSQSADTTHPGMVNNTTQSFSGNKAWFGITSLGSDLATILPIVNSDIINQVSYGIDSGTVPTTGISSWGTLLYYKINSLDQSSSNLRGTIRANLTIQPASLQTYAGVYTGLLFTGSNLLGNITGTFRAARITSSTGTGASAVDQYGLQLASSTSGGAVVQKSTTLSIETSQAIGTDTVAHIAAGIRLVGAITAGGSTLSNTATGIEIGNTITATGTSAVAYAINSLSTAQSVFAGTLSATQLISTIATGTAPLVVASTTQVANLNAATAGSATTATTATNLAGGAGGSIPYQSAAGITAMLANGSAGQVLQSNGTTLAPSWAAAGAGTVTSVAAAGPTGIATWSSAVTTSGTLTQTLSTQSAGTFLAGPTSGAAATPTFRALQAPTIQTFTSGSGTYTTAAGTLYIRVRMVGGGGGGAGSGTSGNGSGGTGGTSTFGTTLLSCTGGAGGNTGGSLPAGGTASLGTGPIGTTFSGGTGTPLGADNGGLGNYAGFRGAATPFGDGGAGGPGGGNAGNVGTVNTGSGGGGASGAATFTSQGGGAAGGYLDAFISAPSATYAYAVGAAGTAGGAGVGGAAGGAGAVGIIIVTEYYQ